MAVVIASRWRAATTPPIGHSSRVYSLSRRLLVSVSVALVVFFGLTAGALDAIFRDLAQRSLRELLDAQMVALVAAAEPDAVGKVRSASTAAEARLQTPGSGLYAEIRSSDGELIWRSPSSAGTFIDFGPAVAAGQSRFGLGRLPDATEVAVIQRGIQWEYDEGARQQLVFSVASSLASYRQQLRQFRTQLLGGFVALALLVVITLALLLRWVIAPVRRMETEIAAVESGERQQLGVGYPRELAGVTSGLNTLLASERRRIARYRESMGNLAHTLKTPLAVIRSVLGGARPADAEQTISGEVQRMTQIIESQLQRAAQSGGPLMGQAAVELAPVVAELRSALLRVHASKDLSVEVRIAPGLQFVGDRNDLTEALGNVLDNACKWCRSLVRVSAGLGPSDGGRNPLLRITVEDDGPGIPAELRASGPERGRRADERTPGHGIGLAMVRETCETYGGALALLTSELGGARIELQLPGRDAPRTARG